MKKKFVMPFQDSNSRSPDQVTPHLRAVLCKNQTKLEMKSFEPPTQIYMEVGPHEGCSKMSIIEVITQLLPW